MEEWISLTEFMQRNKLGYDAAVQLVESGKFEYEKTDGGRYKIKIGGNTVSKEMYDKAIERAIQAETKLNVIMKIVGGKTNENS